MKKHSCPHIVVVGGGAGGLELVTFLGRKFGRKKKARITLVDCSLTHFWKPLLHEVAAGTLNASQNEESYFNHSSRAAYHFELGKMIALDRKNKLITLEAYQADNGDNIMPARKLHYDYLVMAVGSQCNDFATPGVKKHCNFLENRAQAEKFHRLLLQKLLMVEYDQKPVHIAVVGAGATGVELAAELQYIFSHVGMFGFRKTNSQHICLSLIEAGDRILAALPEKVSQATTEELRRLKIEVLTNEFVKEATEDSVLTASGKKITTDMTVWVAGIKAPAFLSTLDGLETNKINQLLTQQNLQTTKDASIFAMGDCAAVPQGKKTRQVPALAQAAHQQAKLLCKSFKRLLKGKPLPNFTFHSRGSLISLSHYTSIGYLMGRLPGRLHLEGRVARLLYLMLYKIHQRTIIGTWRTIVTTVSNFLTRKIRPRLKLH